jgi:hypothetical protein
MKMDNYPKLGDILRQALLDGNKKSLESKYYGPIVLNFKDINRRLKELESRPIE